MTEFKYSEKDHWITMDGHAGNSDICTGESVLIQSLDSYLQTLEGETSAEYSPGHAHLSYQPLNVADSMKSRVAFDLVYRGIVGLALTEPGTIKIVKI